MTNKFQASLIAAAACLHSLADQAKAAESNDLPVAYGQYFNDAFPPPRLDGPWMAQLGIKREGILAPARPLVSANQNANYYGSYLTTFDDSRAKASRRAFSMEKETKAVRKDQTLASPAPPPCGTSPASVEEIKALTVDSAGRHGVDPDFALAVVWTESRFDQVRNSPKGARGPMQLMPETAKRFNVTNVCDPADNIDGGMRYLRTLLDEFKNPIVAAAAYNAGEQAVYDSRGLPAYPETLRYVASVINRQLGFSFPVKRDGRSRNQTTDLDNTYIRDVFGARRPKFIGGVMKF